MNVFVPLKAEPWARFARGSKRVEVRNADSPVAHQVRKAKEESCSVEVRLRLGYGPHPVYGVRELRGQLGRSWEGFYGTMPDWVVQGADLGSDAFAAGFFAKNGRLLCFEVLEIHFVVPPTAEAALQAGKGAAEAIMRLEASK